MFIIEKGEKHVFAICFTKASVLPVLPALVFNGHGRLSVSQRGKVYEKCVLVLVLSVSCRDWVCSSNFDKTVREVDHDSPGCLLGHWSWTAGE